MTAPLPDAAPAHWTQNLPARLRPYAELARLDRPVGIWLLFWPCAAGMALAGGLPQQWPLLALFLLGSFAMRSAGCAYNDIVDRKLDARVERTRGRPLASGAMSLRTAWVIVVALCLLGLGVLLLLPAFAQAVALASLGLVAAYPFMKRVTWWPQLWLGLTFNWGVLVGWAAVRGAIEWPALLLYAAHIAWTLGYDTIYACQDIEDDAIAGIRSSARRLGARVRQGVAAAYAASALLLALACAAVGGWAAAAVIAPALHFLMQIKRLDPSGSKVVLQLFRSNVLAGMLIAAASLAAGVALT